MQKVHPALSLPYQGLPSSPASTLVRASGWQLADLRRGQAQLHVLSVDRDDTEYRRCGNERHRSDQSHEIESTHDKTPFL